MSTLCLGNRDNKCSVRGAECAEGCMFFSLFVLHRESGLFKALGEVE